MSFLKTYEATCRDMGLEHGVELEQASCVEYWLGELGEGHLGADGTYSESMIDRLMAAGRKAGDMDWQPKPEEVAAAQHF